jgi:hypothetical protein
MAFATIYIKLLNRIININFNNNLYQGKTSTNLLTAMPTKKQQGYERGMAVKLSPSIKYDNINLNIPINQSRISSLP